MVKIARQDAYALENIGDGVEIRRQVIAGTKIPDHYKLIEPADAPSTAAAPPVSEPKVEAARPVRRSARSRRSE